MEEEGRMEEEREERVDEEGGPRAAGSESAISARAGEVLTGRGRGAHWAWLGEMERGSAGAMGRDESDGRVERRIGILWRAWQG